MQRRRHQLGFELLAGLVLERVASKRGQREAQASSSTVKNAQLAGREAFPRYRVERPDRGAIGLCEW